MKLRERDNTNETTGNHKLIHSLVLVGLVHRALLESSLFAAFLRCCANFAPQLLLFSFLWEKMGSGLASSCYPFQILLPNFRRIPPPPIPRHGSWGSPHPITRMSMSVSTAVVTDPCPPTSYLCLCSLYTTSQYGLSSMIFVSLAVICRTHFHAQRGVYQL